MYIESSKRYYMIMALRDKTTQLIIGYDLYIKTPNALGWEVLARYKIIQVDNEEYIPKEMIELIRQLNYKEYSY